MNKLFIIGNLTADPELRSTQTGKSVCNFTVAVNRRIKKDGQPDADFFRVSVWEKQGENCAKYLAKGRKVAVIGPVSTHAYESNNGKPGASLDVTAESVEFLSGKQDNVDKETGYEVVTPEDNPFNTVSY